MVRRNFKRLDIEYFLVIYKTYIRPHLEYCIQAWSPHLEALKFNIHPKCVLQQRIQCLQRVQQEAQLMLTTGSTRLLAVSRARDGVP